MFSIYSINQTIDKTNKLKKTLEEETYKPKSVSVNTMLLEYVLEYRLILTSNNIKIPWGKLVVISFDPGLGYNTLGLAFGMYVDEVTIIHINPYKWKFLTNQQKRMVMFHELTHDVFNIEHGSMELMAPSLPKVTTKQSVDRSVEELLKVLKKTKHYEKR